ncbi:MAG: MFS transporter [Hyphomonadaceae bacterium]
MTEAETADRAGVIAEWRAGWRTVVAAAFGSSTGLILFSFIVSVFVRPQTEDMGWTRGEAALSSFSTIAAGMLAPLFGKLSDAWGVRPVILLGGIGYAAAAFGLSVQNGNLPLYYGLMFLLVFLGLGTSSITWGRVVSAGFRKSRGLALSVALSSVTVTAALMPIAIVMVMGQAGWRGAWVLIGVVGLAGSLLGLLLMPKETGRSQPRAAETAVQQKGAGLGEAVRQPAFWCLVLGMTIINIPSGGIMSSMAAIVADKGFGETDVAQVLSAFAISVFLGRAITGVCLDRFAPPIVAFVAMGVPAIGCALLAGGPVIVGVMLFGIVLAGLSQGAEGDVGPFLVSRYFGLASFGAIMGAVNAGVVGGTGLGGLLFGFVFDSYKSYDMALWIGAGCFLFGALLFLGVGFAPARKETAPEGSGAANQIGF